MYASCNTQTVNSVEELMRKEFWIGDSGDTVSTLCARDSTPKTIIVRGPLWNEPICIVDWQASATSHHSLHLKTTVQFRFMCAMCKAAGVYIEKQLSVVRHNLAIHARIARPYIHSHLISLFLFFRTANNACMFEGPQQTPLALKHIYIQMHNAELSSFEATRIRFPQACELVFVAICCCWVAGTTETICSCP